MHHPTVRITLTTVFVTPVAWHWMEREIVQWCYKINIYYYFCSNYQYYNNNYYCYYYYFYTITRLLLQLPLNLLLLLLLLLFLLLLQLPLLLLLLLPEGVNLSIYVSPELNVQPIKLMFKHARGEHSD